MYVCMYGVKHGFYTPSLQIWTYKKNEEIYRFGEYLQYKN